MKPIKVLSLFDGMSCGQIALKSLGIPVEKYFAAEIKKIAIKVTKDNFPDTIHVGDVTKIRFENGVLYTENGDFEVGEIDLFIGGSPCQDLSKANSERKGLEGKKSGMFFEWLRIYKEVKPKYFFLENVSMEGIWLETISTSLGVHPVNINSSLVSAQLRERLYWTNIGPFETNLLGERICTVPQPKDRKILLKDIIESGYTDREKSRALIQSDSRPLKDPVRMIHRYIETGMTTIIFEDERLLELKTKRQGWNKYKEREFKEGEFTEKAKERISERLKDKQGTCYNWYNDAVKNDKTYSLTSSNSMNWGGVSTDIVIKDGVVRYFTQTEMENLQTIPEGYTKCLSRNQAADVLGDGWTVEVVKHFFSYLEF